MPTRPQWHEGWYVAYDGTIETVRYQPSPILTNPQMYVIAEKGCLVVMGHRLYPTYEEALVLSEKRKAKGKKKDHASNRKRSTTH